MKQNPSTPQPSIVVGSKTEFPFSGWEQATFSSKFQANASTNFGAFVNCFCKENLLAGRQRGNSTSLLKGEELSSAILEIPTDKIDLEKITKVLLIKLGIRTSVKSKDRNPKISDEEITQLKTVFTRLVPLVSALNHNPTQSSNKARIWLDPKTGSIILIRKDHPERSSNSKPVPVAKIRESMNVVAAPFIDLPAFTRFLPRLEAQYAEGQQALEKVLGAAEQIIPYLRFGKYLEPSQYTEAEELSHELKLAAQPLGPSRPRHPHHIQIIRTAKHQEGLRDRLGRRNPEGHRTATTAIASRCEARLSEIDHIISFYTNDNKAAVRFLQQADASLLQIISASKRNQNRTYFKNLRDELSNNNNQVINPERAKARLLLDLKLTDDHLRPLNIMPHKLLYEIATTQRDPLISALLTNNLQQFEQHQKIIRDAAQILVLQRTIDDILVETSQTTINGDELDAQLNRSLTIISKLEKSANYFMRNSTLNKNKLEKIGETFEAIKCLSAQSPTMMASKQLSQFRNQLKRFKPCQEIWRKMQSIDFELAAN